MIIKPADVHDDIGKARLGVGLACEALDIQCDLHLNSMWLVKVDGNEIQPFLQLARECAENPA